MATFALRLCPLLPLLTTAFTKPLTAIRRCYIPPPRANFGCALLENLTGRDEFGFNSYGQETTAHRRCLQSLRKAGGNTFVFSVGFCELWTCSKEALTAAASSEKMEVGTRKVFSELCEYQESLKTSRSPVFVKLWEWNYVDIAKECEEYLGPNGFDAVQVSPVTEHILGPEWWTKYQPVSFSLSSRSGSAEDFRTMVRDCRAAGVEVIVDLIINHIAAPCRAAKNAEVKNLTPCVGWNGSLFGNRRLGGARGWDQAGPEHFHHVEGQMMENCYVGPPGWSCGGGGIDVTDCSCCSCDFLKMPDWHTGLDEVRQMHTRHVQELHDIGVTMLRVDLSLFESIEDLSHVLNTVPWDFVYQEWWWERPDAQRHRYIGHFRDITYRYKLTHYLGNSSLAKLPDLFTLERGHDEIAPETAIYPIAFHDGRSWKAKPGNATYKNGLEYHQQQKFLLAWPKGNIVMLWGGFGWSRMSDGPPGCDDRTGSPYCQPESVYVNGRARCLPTPTESPLPKELHMERRWICEHRWQGVAGLIEFRKACRGLPITRTWQAPELSDGQLAFRAGEECFGALVRGYNEKLRSPWGHLGNWKLRGLEVGLPSGRYCDMGSLSTRREWDRRHCPRQVVIGTDGRILSGFVREGDLLAIYVGGRLS
ncbi:unnamed protein product [Durusdinium trenchii]|uniref:4-alpha-D-glucan glucanohydrolase n=2 Tax=Durusdinium trenchii TaxID=1381693 RepID=A0ABP0KFC1_9DINO